MGPPSSKRRCGGSNRAERATSPAPSLWCARSSRPSAARATRPCSATTSVSDGARRSSWSTTTRALRPSHAFRPTCTTRWCSRPRAFARSTSTSATWAFATTKPASRSESGFFRCRGRACTRPGARRGIRRASSCRPCRRRWRACRRSILATPLAGDASDDIIYAAAHLSGVSAIVDAGGAQAIAALAYGTESVPQVDKIVGPGKPVRRLRQAPRLRRGRHRRDRGPERDRRRRRRRGGSAHHSGQSPLAGRAR